MKGRHVLTPNPIFIPGPTNIPEILRRAVDIPSIDHRGPMFGEILKSAVGGVKSILKTQNADVFVFPSTGTGGWEVVITNTLSPADTVLAARNGMFSHRWIAMCLRHGLDVIALDQTWGEGIPTDRFEEILTADKSHRIKAVLATHNETATGVRSDIAAVRRALDAARHPALLFVDGVSSIASMDFRMDDWGVDGIVASSQKGFMLPPGLAIVGLSYKALSAAASANLPRSFFDVIEMKNSNDQNGFPYTPPIGLLNGLKLAAEILLDEGLETVFDRHYRIAEGVRQAVSAWGLQLCAVRRELYSDTVTTICTPNGFDANRIVGHSLKDYGVAFGTGLGELAGKVFRFGHVGWMTDVTALSGIATAEMAMADLGIAVKLGSGVAAAQDYYRTTANAKNASVQ